jgi:hypothetical protein
VLLEDAVSMEQVQRHLASNDEELRADIAEKLDQAMYWWDTKGLHAHRDADEDPVPDFSIWASDDKFVDQVIYDSPAEYNLDYVPRERVVEALKEAADGERRRSRHHRLGGWPHWGPFTWSSDPDVFSFRVETEDSVYFPHARVPDGAEHIPPELAREFWKSLDGQVWWDQVDRVEENWGRTSGSPVYITSNREEFYEWCRDLISAYLNEVVENDPQKAKEVFFSALETENSILAKKLREQPLPDEELLGFVIKWFEGEDEREEVYQTLKEYFAALESGRDDPREVIGEWTQADLRAMGITKGPLYEEAPWKLIKLHPGDLRLEGTLMRHCVGDQGMGYVRALKDGEIEVWSLRSRANKPRFTLEIDTQIYAEDIRKQMREPDADEAVLRAENVKQIKGKANRSPGFAAAHAAEIKFPDEVIFWVSVLSGFGIDPSAVSDMRSANSMYQTVDLYRQHGAFGRPPRRQLQPNTEACVGFDQPYRPLR